MCFEKANFSETGHVYVALTVITDTMLTHAQYEHFLRFPDDSEHILISDLRFFFFFCLKFHVHFKFLRVQGKTKYSKRQDKINDTWALSPVYLISVLYCPPPSS